MKGSFMLCHFNLSWKRKKKSEVWRWNYWGKWHLLACLVLVFLDLWWGCVPISPSEVKNSVVENAFNTSDLPSITAYSSWTALNVPTTLPSADRWTKSPLMKPIGSSGVDGLVSCVEDSPESEEQNGHGCRVVVGLGRLTSWSLAAWELRLTAQRPRED